MIYNQSYLIIYHQMGTVQSHNQAVARATWNSIPDPVAFDKRMDEMARTLDEQEYIDQTRQMVRDGMGQIVYDYWNKYHPRT
jgi:hypothetical protein